MVCVCESACLAHSLSVIQLLKLPPISHSINQPVNQSIRQHSVKQSASQTANQSINQPLVQTTSQASDIQSVDNSINPNLHQSVPQSTRQPNNQSISTEVTQFSPNHPNQTAVSSQQSAVSSTCKTTELICTKPDNTILVPTGLSENVTGVLTAPLHYMSHLSLQ